MKINCKKTPFVIFSLLIILFTSFFYSPVVEGAGDHVVDLFLPVSDDLTRGLPQRSAGGLQEYVALNPTAISQFRASQSSDDSLVIAFDNPFDGKAYFNLGSIQLFKEDGLTITGKTTDAEAEMTLAVVGDELYGSIHTSEAVFRIFPFEDHLYVVQMTEVAAMPQELSPMTPPMAPVEDAGILSTTDSGAQIDVMVVYTSTAKNAVGGTSAMEALIGVAVTETNTGYANSFVDQRLNLAHTAEVSYSEANFNWSEALNLLQYDGDGVMDDVHTWREMYSADIVILLVSDVQACGIAWLMETPSVTFENYAFGIVSTLCATGYYSFGHELGHMMGAHHDRDHASMSGAYPYSYGYQAPDEAFRTVMAYNCSGGCPRVNYYSNPLVNYGGQPTGIDAQYPNAADNALTFNNTAAVVASFRDGAPLPPSLFSAASISSNSISLIWHDNSLDEEGFILQRRISGNPDWQDLAAISSNETSFLDESVSAGLSYDYQIRSWNGNGVSAGVILEEIVTPLYAPYGIDVVAFSQSHIQLSWFDTNFYEDGTQIFRRSDSSASWMYVNAVNKDITQMVDNTLDCGQNYDYQLVAFNQVAASVGQVFLGAKTALCDPTGLTVSPLSAYDVHLSWLDNNQTETAVFIERRQTDVNGDWVVVAELPADQTAFTDETAMCQAAYAYRMRTFDGMSYSRYSTPPQQIEMGSCTVYPEVPLQLSAFPTHMGVELIWQDGRYETGYEIQRALVGSDDWETIIILPMNIDHYFDALSRTDSPYQYRIRSINPLGVSDFTPSLIVDTLDYGLYLPLALSGE